MRKIALVGTAESGAKAPFGDDSYEIWGVSARAACVTRADRWFELHRIGGEPEDWQQHWRKTIKAHSHDVTLYMLYPEFDLGPKVVAYPHERIVQRFGTFFMTSSFAWMMALAIDELRPLNEKSIDGEIAIFGVEMEYGTEYAQQRVGFRHFMDLARVLGIGITRLLASGLSYEPVPYPMWKDDPLLNKLGQRQELSKRQLRNFDESIRHTRTLIAQNRALLEEIDNFGNRDYDAGKRRDFLERELSGLMETSATLSKDIVHWTAIEEEQKWLCDYLAP